jgi:dihydrofolate reductase
MPTLTIVAAVATNGVIGHADGRLPWDLPADLARFKALTWGRTLIMGRRTFLAIGRPLPGRRTLVLTRDPAWRAEGAEALPDLDRAIAAAGEGEVIIAGGGEIYADALPRVDRLRITHVHLDAAGTVRFPEVDWSAWRETRREDHTAKAGRPAFSYVDYERP